MAAFGCTSLVLVMYSEQTKICLTICRNVLANYLQAKNTPYRVQSACDATAYYGFGAMPPPRNTLSALDGIRVYTIDGESK